MYEICLHGLNIVHLFFEAVYSILLNPMMRSSESWTEYKPNIGMLADYISSYSEYIDNKNDRIQAIHQLDNNVRQVSENTTAECLNSIVYLTIQSRTQIFIFIWL